MYCIKGHMNWFPVEYEGFVRWEDHEEVFDNDYQLDVWCSYLALVTIRNRATFTSNLIPGRQWTIGMIAVHGGRISITMSSISITRTRYESSFAQTLVLINTDAIILRIVWIRDLLAL